MSIVDCITSFVDGRVRLRHPALKDKDTADLVCTVVGGVDGITAVQANPVTGSLLIYYDAEKLTREQLLELAEQGAAFIGGIVGHSDGDGLLGGLQHHSANDGHDSQNGNNRSDDDPSLFLHGNLSFVNMYRYL